MNSETEDEEEEGEEGEEVVNESIVEMREVVVETQVGD